jgi:hypothetical protein
VPVIDRDFICLRSRGAPHSFRCSCGVSAAILYSLSSLCTDLRLTAHFLDEPRSTKCQPVFLPGRVSLYTVSRYAAPSHDTVENIVLALTAGYHRSAAVLGWEMVGACGLSPSVTVGPAAMLNVSDNERGAGQHGRGRGSARGWDLPIGDVAAANLDGHHGGDIGICGALARAVPLSLWRARNASFDWRWRR